MNKRYDPYTPHSLRVNSKVQLHIGKPILETCYFCNSDYGLTFPIKATIDNYFILMFSSAAHVSCFARVFRKKFPNTSITSYRNKKNQCLEMCETMSKCPCSKYENTDVIADIKKLKLCIDAILSPIELQKIALHYLHLPVGVIVTDSDKKKSQYCDDQLKHIGMPLEVVDIILQFAHLPILKPECLNGSLIEIIMGYPKRIRILHDIHYDLSNKLYEARRSNGHTLEQLKNISYMKEREKSIIQEHDALVKLMHTMYQQPKAHCVI